MPGDITLKAPVSLPEPVDGRNNFEDLSGIDIAAYENPYEALIEASHGDPVGPLSDPREMYPSHSIYFHLSIAVHSCNESPYTKLLQALLQSRYSTHRTTRNGQQREKLLSPEFSGLLTDPILQRLRDLSIEPGFTDPRHCLVFWARPPSHIRSLAGKVQQKLLALAPSALLSIFFLL